MSFLFAFALASVVFVAAPYLAHRLRRKRAEPRPFAAAHLVPPAPPRARRRSELEDRGLFVTRALAVIALALLGASPFVRCSRLALSRASGASVGLVVVLDDSMSMRAAFGKETRWDRAKRGANELMSSTREGDSVAVVLAGAPARVALAPTTDLRAARGLIEGLEVSDRGTELDSALAMARSLMEGLPQTDRSVVLLSDLADGKPDAPPLGEGSAVPVWNALPELRSEGQDCALVRADRAGLRVRVHVACTPGTRAEGRELALFSGETKVAEAPPPTTESGDAVLVLPSEVTASQEEPGALVARLGGNDAIAVDDAAPVLAEAAQGSLAVVVDAVDERAATGGAPVVEQALAALKLEVTVRPLPQVPDRADDLEPFVGLLVDDPPGFTPEERRSLGVFLEHGGVLLVALGPRAAAAPLGASLEPVLPHAARWETNTVPGVAPKTAFGALAPSAPSLAELGAKHRTTLDAADAALFTPLLEWTDHQPLVLRRTIGRGEVWLVTLPFALDASDLPLRPAFLALLDAFAEAARARRIPQRTDVGAAWTFTGSGQVAIRGPRDEEIPVTRDGEVRRASPPRVGLYHVRTNGRTEVRVAAPVEREVDLRPRRLAPSSASRGVGDTHARVDTSPAIAAVLLFLVTSELVLRLRAGRKVGAA